MKKLVEEGKVFVIRPEEQMIRHFENNNEKLLQCYQYGYDTMRKQFRTFEKFMEDKSLLAREARISCGKQGGLIMKVLVVNGSPKGPKSNTMQMTNAVLRDLRRLIQKQRLSFLQLKIWILSHVWDV